MKIYNYPSIDAILFIGAKISIVLFIFLYSPKDI